jgi:hypothetical protein
MTTPSLIADVAALAVVPQGTPGSTGYTYGIVGVTPDGRKSLVVTDAEASGNAVLDETNFNRMTWTDVAGYESYELWRTVSAGDPSTVGLIGTVLAGVQTFDDTGLVAVAGTANADNNTDLGTEVSLGHYSGDVNVAIGSIGTGTYQVEGSYGGIPAKWFTEGTALTADGVVVVTRKYSKLRINNTAYTTGAPQAFVAGDVD